MNFCCIAATLVLSACSSAPVGSAAHDLEIIHADWIRDVQREAQYSRLPPCLPVTVAPCVSPVVKQRLIRLSYDAQDALTRAEGERTTAAIRKARSAVDAFTKEAKALPGVVE